VKRKRRRKQKNKDFEGKSSEKKSGVVAEEKYKPFALAGTYKRKVRCKSRVS